MYPLYNLHMRLVLLSLRTAHLHINRIQPFAVHPLVQIYQVHRVRTPFGPLDIALVQACTADNRVNPVNLYTGLGDNLNNQSKNLLLLDIDLRHRAGRLFYLFRFDTNVCYEEKEN